MSYHLDLEHLGLTYLKKRLCEEDLIPSYLILREELDERIASLQKEGITTLSQLKERLSKERTRKELSKISGISDAYLTVLKRALGGYTAKVVKLKEYPQTNPATIDALEQHQIKDNIALWTRSQNKEARSSLATECAVEPLELDELVCLTDLSRIQWVSPLFARLLYNAGYKTVFLVSQGRCEEMAQRVKEETKNQSIFKGTVGERDFSRLIYLASLLPIELQI